MELDAHMETAAGGFHCLDQGPVRRSAADGQSRLLQLLPICIVEFKTMSVAFGNLRCAVSPLQNGSRKHLTGIGTQTHGPAFSQNRHLLFHQIYDAVFSLGIKLPAVRVRDAEYVSGILNDGNLHAQAYAQIGDIMLPGIAAGQDHAFNAPVSEAARDKNAVSRPQLFLQVLLREVLGIDPEDFYLRVVFIAAVIEGFPHGQVGIVQSHIFSYNGDPGMPAGMMDPLYHFLPGGQAGHFSGQPQFPADHGIQTVPMQHQRCLIETVHGVVFDDAVLFHVAEQGDFIFDALFQRTVHPGHDQIRMNAQGLQFLDGMLGGLGFVFIGSAQPGYQGHMDEETVLMSLLKGDLADGFDEWLSFNISDRAADFCDQDVGAGILGAHVYEMLDLICYVGNHLHCLSQIFPFALPVQYIPVDSAAGQVRVAGQVFIRETLIMAQIQVRFRPVVCDKDFAVLKRAHGTGIHIHIGVQLLGGYAQAAHFEQPPQRSGCDPFAKSRNNTSCNKNIFRHFFPPILRMRRRPSATSVCHL